MDVFDYLEQVKDRETFIAFVEALAAEREKAEEMEHADPVRYQLGGALDWQNGSISNFLYGALSCLEDRADEENNFAEPSWHAFAEFLYFGKIYERPKAKSATQKQRHNKALHPTAYSSVRRSSSLRFRRRVSLALSCSHRSC